MTTNPQIDELQHHLATELWQEGLDRQLSGELEDAMRLYRCSLEICETAEAHTFLAWGLSFQGQLGDAIEACYRAIATDPELGNPYNDIGAYLVELDREEEAVDWFERSKEARRYDNPQFPYLNLARIWISRGALGRALLELQVAEVLAPRIPVWTSWSSGWVSFSERSSSRWGPRGTPPPDSPPRPSAERSAASPTVVPSESCIRRRSRRDRRRSGSGWAEPLAHKG